MEGLLTTEEVFYAEVSIDNIHKRLERVPTPLRYRIVADLHYEGLVFHAPEYLRFYDMAAKEGDMVSMAEHDGISQNKIFQDQINESDPLAWGIHLQYNRLLEESWHILVPLVDTSLRALYYCWSSGLYERDDSKAVQRLFESRYLPAIPELATRYPPQMRISEYALHVATVFGHASLTRRYLLNQENVLPPRQLANIAISNGYQLVFIRERLRKNITDVERYMYGQHPFHDYDTMSQYLEIRKRVLDWIHCFTGCLLVTRMVPHDVRRLLTKWVWSVRFDYLELHDTCQTIVIR